VSLYVYLFLRFNILFLDKINAENNNNNNDNNNSSNKLFKRK
jgi:hypothetical protein